MGETEQVGTGLRAELRAYVEEAFLYLHPDVELRDEDGFLELGIVDSLGFVELVEEVQSALRDRGRRARDHRGELRLDRRARRVRESGGGDARSTRTCGARRRPRRARRRSSSTAAGASPSPSWTPPRARLRRACTRSGSSAATASRCCCPTAPRRRSRSTGRCAPAPRSSRSTRRSRRASSPTCCATARRRRSSSRRGAGAGRARGVRAGAERAARARDAERPRRRAGRRRAARPATQRRPRRDRLHLRLDRRAEGRDAHAREHDVRGRLDRRVPRDGGRRPGPVRHSARRSTTASTSC